MGEQGFSRWLLQTNRRKKEQLFGKTSGSSCWRQPGTRRGLSGRWSETRHYRTPRAPSELWEQPSRHRIPALKSNDPGGSAGAAHSRGSGTSRPRLGVQPRTAASRLMQPFGSEPWDFPALAKKKKKRDPTRFLPFSQAAGGEYSLTYFFLLSPLYFNLLWRCSSRSLADPRRSPQRIPLQAELPPCPTLGISPTQQHCTPLLAQSGGRASQKAPGPSPCATQSCRNPNPRPPHGGITL